MKPVHYLTALYSR